MTTLWTNRFAGVFAIIVVAGCAYSTVASAQNVYRCGSTYSQVPCPNGTEVNVQDPRSDEQKKASDVRVKQDMGLANRLEADRQKEEDQLRTQRAKAAAAEAKAQAKADAKAQAAQAKASQAANANPSAAVHPATKPRPKHKEPEFFTARSAPPEKPQAGASTPKK